MRLPLPVITGRVASPGAARVANVAHRGASAAAPENTRAALERAVALGADLVEVDVQRSKDGALVLVHDTTLARTTDARRMFPHRAPWRVRDFTHAELMRLDAGSWKGARFTGERLATLPEALALLGRTRTGLLLELKAPDLYPGLVADVVTTLRAHRGLVDRAVADGRLVVQSFSFAAMKEHKTRAPDVPVGLLGRPDPENLPALATWADQVNPGHRAVDRPYVERLHELGMTCQVWTVNREAAMRRVIGLGVDGVITNRPAALRKVLSGR